MTNIYVDVVETGATDSGHTAIRISGLASLPPDPTFRIDPIDETLMESSDVDWPAGPRRPQSVIPREGAFDLVLGPDVLESPLLLPGTPVVISITDTPIVKELIWPSIPTRVRRKRRPVIVTAELREQERSAYETKKREAVAALEATTMRVQSEATAAAAAAAAAFVGASFRPGGLNGSAGLKQNGASATSGHVLPGADAPRFSGADAPKLSRENDSAAGLSGFSRPKGPPGAEPVKLVLKDGRPAGATSLPAKASSTALANVSPSLPQPAIAVGRQVGAFFGGMVAAALLVLGLIQMKLLQWQPATAATVASPDAALSAARSASTLRAILATSGVSPRGKSTNGVEGAQALALADTFLHGAKGSPRDQGEASFWLRHALTQSIDQDGMRWALTQLGSIFAAPEGFEPDFVKARMLWEVAGGLGDPVALCFNASLYEHGLGVPRHKDLARALYERARTAGGCSGIDGAISRTK